MKRLWTQCMATIAVMTICLTAHGQSKPNIVVYLVDDMGWMDTSLPFADKPYPLNKKFHTPNMEKLAKQGMMFTNAYAAPVCTPTRVSLITGMNPAHHKVTNWTSLEKNTPSDNDSDTATLRPPEWNINGMSPVAGISRTVHATPLPQLLKDAGYFTIHAGKAHFASSGTPGADPVNLGYVVNIAGSNAGQPGSYYGEDNYGNTKEEWSQRAVQNMTEFYGSETYLTDALSSQVLKALEFPINKKEPFFLYYGQFAVHLPNQANPAFVDRYLKAGLSKKEAGYASMIESMDKSLGDLMDYLDARGIADNTLFIFMSDNGGNSVAAAKGGEMHHGNDPLREGKGSVYEGGIREPMIVRWPGVVKPGTKTDMPVIIEDYFPTLLEIAGVTNSKILQSVDGESFVPTLKDAAAGNRERSLVFHYPNKWKKDDLTDIDFLSAIRQGDWKLVYRMTSGTLELYNTKDDIGEKHNVAAKHPDKVKALAGALSEKYRIWKSQMPINKKTNKPVALPDQLP